MSVAAENVIGGILIGGKDAYWRVADMLRPEDFCERGLAQLFRICGDIAKSSADLDVVTVGDEAERQGVMSAADVIGIAGATASAANIRSHAERVGQAAMQRRFRAICTEGAKTGDMATVQAQLSALLAAQPAHAVHASAVLLRMWDSLMARLERGDEVSGISTGIPRLDELTGGLQPGRLWGIGARAKMGKTMLAMNICANVARAGKAVAVWSLEMSDEELMQRMTCAGSGVPSQVMQHPRILSMERDEIDQQYPHLSGKVENATARLNHAMKELKQSRLRVSDRTDVSVEEIESQLRQMHAEGELDVACIDYLGLMRAPKADRHDLAVAHMTRRCKIIAKELGITMILVFQLNRGNEKGAVVRWPIPSDAKDSGSIEADVDAMLLLHRPSYYDKSAPKGLRLDLAIQRNGPTGLIHMNDELDCCRFTGGTEEWVDSSHSSGRDDNL